MDVKRKFHKKVHLANLIKPWVIIEFKLLSEEYSSKVD